MRPPILFLRPALAALVVLALTGAGFAPARARAVAAPADSGSALERALAAAAPHIDRRVLDLALASRAQALRAGLVRDPSVLTVIDYSLPSVEPRFFVFDLPARRLVFQELVAHGRNSGANLATRFSNLDASRETSLGLYVTGGTYVGEHGRSLRLVGLEPGFNDRAETRGIVVHAAAYVSAAAAAKLGRLGRSWGCPALSPAVAQKVIDRIQGGSALFAYYPDARWLDASRFLAARPAQLAALTR